MAFCLYIEIFWKTIYWKKESISKKKMMEYAFDIKYLCAVNVTVFGVIKQVWK